MKSFHRPLLLGSLFVFGLIFVSCAGLRISSGLALDHSAWQMYGKDSRHNSMSMTASSGLEKIWGCDVDAGIGNCSPTIENEIVYVGNLKGEIHAIDLYTGKELASKSFGGAIFGSPVLSDSMMVVASSQSTKNILVYDLHSGQTVWSKNIADVESSPVVFKNRIFVATLDGDLYDFELQTGITVFDKKLNSPIRSSPVVNDSLCVFGCDDGSVYAFGTVDGTEKWRYKTGSSVWCSPSITDSTVFVGTNGGKLVALTMDGKMEFEFKTGEKILSMPIADDTGVYFGSDDGNFYALNKRTGSLIWKFHSDAPITTAAAQSTTQIFVGSLDGNLYAVDKKDGKIQAKINLEGRVRTQPAIYGNYLVIGAEDSEIYGFKIK